MELKNGTKEWNWRVRNFKVELENVSSGGELRRRAWKADLGLEEWSSKSRTLSIELED